MRSLSVSLITALLLWGVNPTSAQNRANINRPSQQTGSALLGQIGGRNTRTTEAPTSLRASSIPSSSLNTTAPLAIPGLGPRRATGYYAGALSVGSVTVAPPRSPGVFQIGFAQTAQARRLSALDYASDPRLNVAQIERINRLPGLATPVYLREASGSAFHRVFGLTPADQTVRDTKPTSFPSDLTQADLMHANLAVRKNVLIERALEAFTGAMDDRPLTEPERIQDLKDAESRLQTVVQLANAEASAELNLCLLHISMELGQIGAATSLIDAALQANPRLFIDQVTIAKRMGDYEAERDYSRHLEDHYRRYISTANYNADSVEAQIITGYCAVYLKDWRRLQDAVDYLGEAVFSASQREPLDRFLWAVKPVIEQRP